MTSGIMKCPSCGGNVKWADYEYGSWVEYNPPWLCSGCGKYWVPNKVDGYGLLELPRKSDSAEI